MSARAYWVLLLSMLSVRVHGIGDTENSGDLAVVIVPVADAIPHPLQILDFSKSVTRLYRELPFAPEIGEHACPRFHQLLYNEVVRVKQVLKDEVECEIFNVFYEDCLRGKMRSLWTQKKNIRPLAELRGYRNDLSAIPSPYTSHRKKSLDNILSLAWPWHDKGTDTRYSAGTRFVRVPKSDTADHYAVAVVQNRSRRNRTLLVPKECAVVTYPEDKTESIQAMLELIRKWAQQKQYIPYVWGGCSLIDTYSENIFSLVSAERYGETLSFWIRPEKKAPHVGLECTGLIFRAAQIYGLPYYFKNTATIVRYLEPLKPDGELTEGDLIWYAGHVLMVSNKAENLVIESVGYKAGFGKVHEVPLSSVFKDIATYDELIQAYHDKKPLRRIDITGNVIRNLPSFLLLKFDSIYKF